MPPSDGGVRGARLAHSAADGAAALARKLPQDVRSLELGDSGIGAAGAAALATTIFNIFVWFTATQRIGSLQP